MACVVSVWSTVLSVYYWLHLYSSLGGGGQHHPYTDVQPVALDKAGTVPERAPIFRTGDTGLFQDDSKGWQRLIPKAMGQSYFQ